VLPWQKGVPPSVLQSSRHFPPTQICAASQSLVAVQDLNPASVENKPKLHSVRAQKRPAQPDGMHRSTMSLCAIFQFFPGGVTVLVATALGVLLPWYSSASQIGYELWFLKVYLLPELQATGVGVTVGVGVAVPVGVAVGVAVGEPVGVGVGAPVAVAVGAGVMVAVLVVVVVARVELLSLGHAVRTAAIVTRTLTKINCRGQILNLAITPPA
jgi:hypothetical protein